MKIITIASLAVMNPGNVGDLLVLRSDVAEKADELLEALDEDPSWEAGHDEARPGAEIVVGAMGLLFEAGKLTSFAMLHRRSVPRLLRGALATVGLTLMAANVAGVSGFLSSQYERTHITAHATSHTAETTAHASASLVERQLAAAESNLAA